MKLVNITCGLLRNCHSTLCVTTYNRLPAAYCYVPMVDRNTIQSLAFPITRWRLMSVVASSLNGGMWYSKEYEVFADCTAPLAPQSDRR